MIKERIVIQHAFIIMGQNWRLYRATSTPIVFCLVSFGSSSMKTKIIVPRRIHISHLVFVSDFDFNVFRFDFFEARLAIYRASSCTILWREECMFFAGVGAFVLTPLTLITICLSSTDGQDDLQKVYSQWLFPGSFFCQSLLTMRDNGYCLQILSN
jgi:hypothetical protein